MSERVSCVCSAVNVKRFLESVQSFLSLFIFFCGLNMLAIGITLWLRYLLPNTQSDSPNIPIRRGCDSSTSSWSLTTMSQYWVCSCLALSATVIWVGLMSSYVCNMYSIPPLGNSVTIPSPLMSHPKEWREKTGKILYTRTRNENE